MVALRGTRPKAIMYVWEVVFHHNKTAPLHVFSQIHCILMLSEIEFCDKNQLQESIDYRACQRIVMIGSLLSRVLIMVFGYAYPAYECFKEVGKDVPETEQLIFWCKYWILVAFFAICERIGDNVISWLPIYSEAKLAFLIYLWYPKTKGADYFYDSFIKPFVAKHETEIDSNLSELKAKGGEYALTYWQIAVNYGQAKLFEILHHVLSTSVPQPKTSFQEVPSVKIGETDPANPDEDQSQKLLVKTATSNLSQQETVPEESKHPSGRWTLFQSSANH